MGEHLDQPGNDANTHLVDVKRRRNWLNRMITGQSGERLAAALDVYQVEMNHLCKKINRYGIDLDQYGIQDLFELLEISSSALKSYDLELGWSAFNAAQRIETQIYYELSQERKVREFASGSFRARAIGVHTEGNQKLNGWRKKTLNTLLSQKVTRPECKDEKVELKSDVELSDLLTSQQILGEHNSNVYRRLKIVQRQFIALTTIALLAIAGWVVFLIFQPKIFVNKVQVYDLTLTIPTMILGVLGACISGILTLANSSIRQNIPEKQLNAWVTYARPLVGAVSALVIVFFVLVGILEIGEQSPGLYLAAAFSAGFSERILIKTIETVAGKSKSSDKPT